MDCFLNGESTDKNQKSEFPIRTFYFKLMLFSLMPFLLFAASYGVWSIISMKQNDKKILQTKAISTVVILLFLVHPNIVNFVFNVFNCISIDGEDRVKNDLEILCYEGSHFFYSMSIALPSLFVWGLGIPLFAFLLMFKERKRLDTLLTR